MWSGDEGTTEASGQTRRYGLEVGARYHYKNWIFADLDATFTHARFRVNAGNGDAVALEIQGLGKLEITVRDDLKRTWARETRLERTEKGHQDLTPQLTGKYAKAPAKAG